MSWFIYGPVSISILIKSVGVEHEEAGEKWRAGDAAKSMRFFMRAINTYDEGLKKHPAAFDLAYNKYVMVHYPYIIITT